MPLMRAKFERCGQPIPMRIEKRDYIFQKDHRGDFVAMVDAENHVNYLLDTGNFEIVVPESEEEMLAQQAAPTAKKTTTKKAASQKDTDEANLDI